MQTACVSAGCDLECTPSIPTRDESPRVGRDTQRVSLERRYRTRAGPYDQPIRS